MQKADSILKNIPLVGGSLKGDQQMSDISNAAHSTTASVNHALGRDRIDAVNQMFAEFELAYHNQYHKAYAQDKSVGVAKKYWLSCLSSYAPETILQATRTVVGSMEFLPSVAALVKACEEVMTIPGLPSSQEAYQEACCAPSPKSEYLWSHAIVYHAGKNTGWFALANESAAKIFPLYDYHYQLLCKRLLDGESLTLKVPQALPSSGAIEMSAQEKKARIAEMRESLDL